ncbi:Dipeptide transport system permease protein DppC [Candidatus Burkholderia crenata]|nr:Dipeptide transport system permease protein DppC [Candidatus Burkholderia crenata]
MEWEYRRWCRFASNPLSVFGLVILMLLIVFAAIGPSLPLHDPLRQVLSDRLLPPHWFGTDQLGRDILALLVIGSRLTLSIAILVVPVGLLIGTTAGFCGGFVDIVLMRLTDIALAFPKIVLALAFAAALGPGVINAVIAISITAWPPYARLARRGAAVRPGRFHPRGALARGIVHADPAVLYRLAVFVVGDRARDARYGGQANSTGRCNISKFGGVKWGDRGAGARNKPGGQ